jgi:methionyl aminopeptidase
LTSELEEAACRMMAESGGRPSFKGYKSGIKGEAFPTALCLSINDEIVHGPSLPARRIESGDILSIDAGMEYPCAHPFKKSKKDQDAAAEETRPCQGLFTDAAITVPVGKVSRDAKKLIAAARESLDCGIRAVRPGAAINDVGRAIETAAKKNGFSVVRDLVGHGVGYGVHEEPQVPNFVVRERGFLNHVLKAGMILAIEPMLTAGGHEIAMGQDPFTILTADGSLAAHFEHTVAVVEKGFEILTKK